MDLLACGGPFMAPGAFFATAIIFLLLKPLSYFAFILAFRYRVCGPIPMRPNQAITLAVHRTLLGVFLVGGGAYYVVEFMGSVSNSERVIFAVSWIYMYLARAASWWIVGKCSASLRGRRLVGWICGGLVINVGFDLATYGGLVQGWTFPMVVIPFILGFIAVVNARGRRDSLRLKFSEVPHCHQCTYNLTGNLSGICPECGTPIPVPVIT